MTARFALLCIGLLGCGRVGFSANDNDDLSLVADAAGCPGHDEDADGVGDTCDVCPTVADPDQADVMELVAGAQADGVGDACDPHPSRPGDRIAWFDPFTIDLGAYAIVGPDAFSVADRLTLNEENDGLHFTGPDTYTRVAARFHTNISASNSGRWVGIWVNIHGDLTDAIFAQGYQSMSDPMSWFIKEAVAGADLYSPSTGDGYGYEVARDFTMVIDSERATGTDMVMTVTDHEHDIVIAEHLAVTQPPSTEFKFESQSVTSQVDYLIIYASD